MVVERLEKNSFESYEVSEKIGKSPKMAVLAIFGLILTIFLRSQSYDFDATAQAEWLC